MNIKATIKTSSPIPRIEKKDDTYLIYVSSEAKHNEANIEVIKMLSKYFGIPWKNIKIKSGLKNKNKLIEVKK